VKLTIFRSVLLLQLGVLVPPSILYGQLGGHSNAPSIPAGQNTQIGEWFPLSVGDTWIYAVEARDGTEGGTAHPRISRFQLVDTIRSAKNTPDGTILEMTTVALQPAPKEARSGSSHLLVRDNCVYAINGINAIEDYHALDQAGSLTPEFRGLLLAGEVSPQFCFPLSNRKVWGSKSDFVWRVVGASRDAGGNKVFHVTTYLGSGSLVDVWFQKGRGVVRERERHRGTYWEVRTRLLHTQFAGHGVQ
jgi:hypothetical protein